MSKIESKIWLNWFTYWYLFVLGIDIYAIYLHNEYRWYTKPFILGSLLLYFVWNARELPQKIYLGTTFTLLFSALSDIFLLSDDDTTYYLVGLGLILISHSFFIYVLQQNNRPIKHITTKFSSYFLLISTLVVLYFMWPQLGLFYVPIILYCLFILMLVFSAINHNKNATNNSYIWLVVGSLMFLLSDLLLASENFMGIIPIGNAIIMVTYAIAEFILIFGIWNFYDASNH